MIKTEARVSYDSSMDRMYWVIRYAYVDGNDIHTDSVVGNSREEVEAKYLRVVDAVKEMGVAV